MRLASGLIAIRIGLPGTAIVEMMELLEVSMTKTDDESKWATYNLLPSGERQLSKGLAPTGIVANIVFVEVSMTSKPLNAEAYKREPSWLIVRNVALVGMVICCPLRFIIGLCHRYLEQFHHFYDCSSW